MCLMFFGKVYLNLKNFFPVYINRDLIRLKLYDKALIGWCYFVNKKVLDANS